MNVSYADKDTIILTSEQWELRANKYMVINKGVICIEIKTPELILVKVGVGNKYFKDLPYVHGGDGHEIDLSSYAKITYVDNKINEVNFDINELKQFSHSHSNKCVLDNTTASYTIDEKNKLNGIEYNANNYVLPEATSNQLGGVKVGNTLTVDTDGLINIDFSKIPSVAIMTGATDESDGESGLVPKPIMGDNNKYLKGDGTFDIPIGTTYEVFIPSTYGYEDIDEETGETVHISGEGKIGLVPAPPERNYEEEYLYGNKYLCYDGEWSYLPQQIPFIPASNVNAGKQGLVPAPQIGDINKFLCSDGNWRDVGDIGYEPAYISEGFETSFRTQVIYTPSQSNFFKLIQSNDNIEHAPLNGTGLAFGVNNSNGYIYIDDDTPIVFIGGGNEDQLSWIKQLAFIDDIPIVDDTLSIDSTNPVQNKVITEKINEIDNTISEIRTTIDAHTLSIEEINEKINELPKLEFNTKEQFPILGDINTLYVATDEDVIYRWDDSIAKYKPMSYQSGVASYNSLTDLPSLNGIQIIGDKTNEEYDIKELTNQDIEDILT